MKNYTDNEFYVGTFLAGKEAVVSAAFFDCYARSATMMIKQFTGTNIDETINIPEEVQMCCCEIAEAIRKDEKEDHGGKTSEKVIDTSVSYVSPEIKQREFETKIRKIINMWLADTGLLYRGC